MSATFVLLSGETTQKEASTLAPVATLSAKQVSAILSGSLEGLKLDEFKASADTKIVGVGVSAKKLKDGTYCFVLTVDMID